MDGSAWNSWIALKKKITSLDWSLRLINWMTLGKYAIICRLIEPGSSEHILRYGIMCTLKIIESSHCRGVYWSASLTLEYCCRNAAFGPTFQIIPKHYLTLFPYYPSRRWTSEGDQTCLRDLFSACFSLPSWMGCTSWLSHIVFGYRIPSVLINIPHSYGSYLESHGDVHPNIPRYPQTISTKAGPSSLRTRVVVCVSLVLVAGAFLISEAVWSGNVWDVTKTLWLGIGYETYEYK